MAATVDNRPTGNDVTFRSLQKHHQERIEIDFSVTANNLAQNETMALLNIPAGIRVRSAGLYVETDQDDITDVDLGLATDGTTDNSLIDGATLAETGYVEGECSDTLVTAATQLVFTNIDANDLDEAKVHVLVELVDCRVDV